MKVMPPLSLFTNIGQEYSDRGISLPPTSVQPSARIPRQRDCCQFPAVPIWISASSTMLTIDLLFHSVFPFSGPVPTVFVDVLQPKAPFCDEVKFPKEKGGFACRGSLTPSHSRSRSHGPSKLFPHPSLTPVPAAGICGRLGEARRRQGPSRGPESSQPLHPPPIQSRLPPVPPAG